MIELPAFNHKEELQEHLVENKSLYITKKKSQIKKADGYSSIVPSGIKVKNEAESGDLSRRLIINTTKVFDSHSDVHIDGIWKKSLKENPPTFLLKEHDMSFDSVITRDIKAYTQTFTFNELGFKRFGGETEALVFDANIGNDIPQMRKEYEKGNVTNHSVGMHYVKLFLAINNESNGYEDEFATWNKYFDQIANKSDAESAGFFWAVTEAKAIEGSAVLRGSNFVTPTLEPKHIEPSKDTQTKSYYYNLLKSNNNV